MTAGGFLIATSVALLVIGAAGLQPRRALAVRPEAPTRSLEGSPKSGVEARIMAAGRESDLDPRAVVVARWIAGLAGLITGLAISGIMPSGIGRLVVVVAAVAGAVSPDFLLERAAVRRRAAFAGGLPDALDMLAVSVSAGSSLGAAMRSVARTRLGPVAGEFGRVADRMAAGLPMVEALEELAFRAGAPEVRGFVSSMVRSHRLGSPLETELVRQASALRADRHRATAVRAARAAPKIQLVIALVLVPAVLLLVAAAILANGDQLFGFAFGYS